MVIVQRLAMCIELVKLAIELVFAIAEAVGIVIRQNMSPDLSNSYYSAANIPFLGFLP